MRNLVQSLGLALLVVVAGYPSHGYQREASEIARYGLGPELSEYMRFLDAEVAELTHLHEAGDVTAADFRLSRDRLEATRAAAIRLARSRDEDRVPDLYLLVDAELTQILPAGVAAVRGKKAGDPVGEEFVYHGRIRRSVSFNILERIGTIPRANPYAPD